MILSLWSLASDPVLAFSMPGGPEWGFILLIVVLLFGAKKLPELARGIGASIGEFKRARQAIDDEIKKAEQELAVRETETPKGVQPRPPAALGNTGNSEPGRGPGA